jgi:hypothetical protein
LGQQQNDSTADIENKSAVAEIQPPTEDWTPPKSEEDFEENLTSKLIVRGQA